MRKNVIISLILLTLVICLPFYLPVGSAEANGNANTPTFELNLEPASPTTWADWRPEYKTNAEFVATLKGETKTGQSVRIDSVTYTFTLDSSEWPGICMNANGDDDTGRSVDLFFREEDNRSGSRQTLRRDVQFVRMSSSGYRESHSHDIDITEEAPNYTVANLNT